MGNSECGLTSLEQHATQIIACHESTKREGSSSADFSASQAAKNFIAAYRRHPNNQKIHSETIQDAVRLCEPTQVDAMSADQQDEIASLGIHGNGSGSTQLCADQAELELAGAGEDLGTIPRPYENN